MKRYQTSKTHPAHALSSLYLDEVADRVRAMRMQEETTYLYRRFLPSGIENDGQHSGETTTTSLGTTYLVWREKICQWSYNVVDQ
jgi:hypothetical protein